MGPSYVGQNAERVFAELDRVSRACGRGLPTLVAVTKGGTDEEVLALLDTGLVRHVAENRTDRLLARKELLIPKGYHPAFHLIGTLQTNKVKTVVGETSLIQSLDSRRLAEAIEKRAVLAGVETVDCLLEINSGRESAKGGVLPEEAESLLREVGAYSHIRVRGLMTMGPAGATEEKTRRCFSETRRLFERLGDKGAWDDRPILSMGMSDSYLLAVEEGANMVRIGRAFWKHN